MHPLGTHITHYREAYFTQNPYTHQWTIQAGAEDRITEKIADVVLTLRRERKPDDKPTFIDRAVRLTDAERKRYDAFEREYFTELPDGAEITAVHAAALTSKLLQLSGGAVYDAEGKTHHIHDAKIEALTELVEEAQGENAIAVYWFKSSLEKIRKAFPSSVLIDKEGKAIREWNAGKIKMLLLHPQSASMGLNLQHGGSIMIFYDVPWSAELYMQTCGRIDRQGQERPVRFYHLRTEKTVDDVVARRIDEKQAVQEYFLQRVEEIKRGRQSHR